MILDSHRIAPAAPDPSLSGARRRPAAQGLSSGPLARKIALASLATALLTGLGIATLASAQVEASPRTAAIGADADKPAEKTLNLSADDNGKTIDMADARIARISLAGNPTTGYSWSIAKVDGKSVTQDGALEYERGPANRVGSGGVYHATFNVAAPGKTTITMEYRRPWEKNNPPARTFTVTLNVPSPASK